MFVTATRGTGWVPLRHLAQTPGQTIARVAHDTTELSTHLDEVLAVIRENLPSGWLWCRSGDGREGWVPARTVEATS